MTRTEPNGVESNYLEMLYCRELGIDERKRITDLIAHNDGGPTVANADLPSAHLRYGLKLMRERGWSKDGWGDLKGDGPICILESVRAPFDCPSVLDLETPEQYYIRKAFVQLGLPSPKYVAVWNDEQESFGTVEMVMETAIFAAEADESRGEAPYKTRGQTDLVHEFGLDPLVDAKE